MRFVLSKALCLVAMLILDARPTHAQSAYDYPWCAYYSGRGGTSCYFSSYGQCRASVSGVGGHCSPNPVFRGGGYDRWYRRGYWREYY
jgi:hypothetical protein